MKYVKPELVLVAPAIRAIQSDLTKDSDTIDSDPFRTSNSAYEADE